MSKRVILFLFLNTCLLLSQANGQIVDTVFKTNIGDSIRQLQIDQQDTVKFLDSLQVADSLSKLLPIDSVTTNKYYSLKGKVLDANNHEGIPFATVYFAGTGIGTTADIDGYFELELESLPKDSITFSAIGYELHQHKLNTSIKVQHRIFPELPRSENTLGEVVVRAGEDPAIVLMKKVIKNKDHNNPDNLKNYSYEVYNKMEIDVQRLSKAQFEKLPLMKPFSFIYDNMDTLTDELPFLPFYLIENLSHYYFQTNPKKSKEFIIANQTKGINNESIMKFSGAMYQNVNIYKNYIPVVDQKFVSPISNSGLFYYNYKILDTQYAFGHRLIQLSFRQKRSGEKCFFGDLWVVDSVFAIQKIGMQIPKDANLNWLSNVTIMQEFAPQEDTLWFCVKEKFTASLIGPYGAKLPGFIGRKTTMYKDFAFNQDSIDAVINNPKYRDNTIVLDDAKNKSKEYWESARHDSLSKNEKAIYAMIDTLEGLPVFNRTKNTIKFLAMGIKDVGPIEIGPVFNLYSYNRIEGNRFRLNVGTNPKLFKDIYLNGCLAYGTRDQQFKYKVAGLWLLDRKPRMYLYGAYTKDVDNTTNYYSEATTDNIFSIAVRKNNLPWKLSMNEEARLEFYKEYFNGFSHMLTLINKKFDPYNPLPDNFIDDNGQQHRQVISSEINLKLRFAYLEEFLEGNYYRVSTGTKFPVLEMRMGVGLKGVLGSQYQYQKASFSIADNVYLGPIGKLYYNFYTGKYWGNLPYPLLEIMPGNDFYVYNSRAFNMMTRYEFLSDQYIGLNIEHNLGGSLFNYVPLLKKAKMRLFWNAKAVYGSLSEKNQILNNYSQQYQFKDLKGNPYVELGTGIENIFQFLRVDFVWRVLPESTVKMPLSQQFGIFGSVKFAF